MCLEVEADIGFFNFLYVAFLNFCLFGLKIFSVFFCLTPISLTFASSMVRWPLFLSLLELNIRSPNVVDGLVKWPPFLSVHELVHIINPFSAKIDIDFGRGKFRIGFFRLLPFGRFPFWLLSLFSFRTFITFWTLRLFSFWTLRLFSFRTLRLFSFRTFSTFRTLRIFSFRPLRILCLRPFGLLFLFPLRRSPFRLLSLFLLFFSPSCSPVLSFSYCSAWTNTIKLSLINECKLEDIFVTDKISNPIHRNYYK